MATCDKCGGPLIHHEDKDGNDEVYCPACEGGRPLTRPHPDQAGERAFKEGLKRLVLEGAPKEPCPECGAVNWYPVGCWWSCGGKDGHPCGHLFGVNEPLGQPKDAGPSPCDFEPCVGQKCRISCDKCMTIIKEVRGLDEKGWNGVLKPAPAQAQPPGKPGSLDAAFTRGVEFIVEKSPPAPVRPERCPNDPLGAKCFPDDCHCWDPVDGCTALPTSMEPVVELPDLVLEIWAKDGKADEWRMSDPSNPGRALGGLDIEWIKAAISPAPAQPAAPPAPTVIGHRVSRYLGVHEPVPPWLNHALAQQAAPPAPQQPTPVSVCPVGYDTCEPCRPFVIGSVLPCGVVGEDGKPHPLPVEPRPGGGGCGGGCM